LNVEARLERAREALAEAWVEPGGVARVAAATAAVSGGMGLMYLLDKKGRFRELGHTAQGRPSSSWETLAPGTLAAASSWLSVPQHAALRKDDVSRFVELTETIPDAAKRRAYVDSILRPHGTDNQARMVLSSRRSMRVWFGVLWKGKRPPRDLPALTRLHGALADMVRAADLTEMGMAQPSAAQALMDLSERPVWLVTPGGTVVNANVAARSLERAETREARRAALAGDSSRCALSRVSLGGDELFLVVGRAPVVAPAVPLPPSLLRVAECVARGLSDKEISNELNMPYETARTYVRRARQALGARNRVEVAVRLRARQGQ
jgi:hypothetical protein